MRSSVVLPQPLEPSRQTNWFCGTVKLTVSSTRLGAAPSPPYTLVSDAISSIETLSRYGVTTTLPKISRSRMRRKPSAACSSGSTLSITGLILPCWIRSISADRLSS